MTNLNALQRVLPISGLEPQWEASIDGFSDKPRKDWWQEKITFLEPPAGLHIPYVDARSAMALLFKHQGMPAEDAKAKADAEWSELKEQLDSTQRVVFYDYLEKNPGEHIPVPALLLHLRRRKLVSDHIADFLDQAVATVVSTPMFAGPDNWDGLHLRTAGFLLIKKKENPTNPDLSRGPRWSVLCHNFRTPHLPALLSLRPAIGPDEEYGPCARCKSQGKGQQTFHR